MGTQIGNTAPAEVKQVNESEVAFEAPGTEVAYADSCWPEDNGDAGF